MSELQVDLAETADGTVITEIRILKVCSLILPINLMIHKKTKNSKTKKSDIYKKLIKR